MISITVNSTVHQVEDNISITKLLLQLSQPENGIAIAINNQVILKQNWALKIIKNNDTILIIQATQGG